MLLRLVNHLGQVKRLDILINANEATTDTHDQLALYDQQSDLLASNHVLTTGYSMHRDLEPEIIDVSCEHFVNFIVCYRCIAILF